MSDNGQVHVEFVGPPPKRYGAADARVTALIAAARKKPGEWASVAVPEVDYHRVRRSLDNTRRSLTKQGEQVRAAGRKQGDDGPRLYFWWATETEAQA